MICLGIETSCDETAISVVRCDGVVLAHEVASQAVLHAEYGGVVPEIASRNHLELIKPLYKKVLEASGLRECDIDLIAVTAGPGLIGGLLVGVMFAKGLAIKLGRPIIGLNHLEAHALTATLTEAGLGFPYKLLLVSGGHCQILNVEGVGLYKLIGKTRDDSVGEAFDKVAKMLGMGYPGGPIVERNAKSGDERAFDLPVPILRDAPYDFSFSGLKTAVKRIVDAQHDRGCGDSWRYDMCATFQRVVGDVLVDRMCNVVDMFGEGQVVIAGGVAANMYLRGRLEEGLRGCQIFAPPISLCTDNGIMVAWCGIKVYESGVRHELSFEPRSRWPLGELLESRR